MECHWKMDFACSASVRRALIISFLVFLVLSIFLPCAAEETQLGQLRQLVDSAQWQKAVQLAEAAPQHSADFYFLYGTALAQIGRLDDARRAFQTGQTISPHDERFPVELAGVDFKQKHFASAARQLRHALKLNPSDSYAQNFLATVYFLQGNLDAAIEHWNRIGKPRIERVPDEPVPPVDPALLDRAFAFSPAGTLKLSELFATEARLRALQIFPSFAFRLEALPDGNFNAVFHNTERPGWKQNKWLALGVMLRGLPAQSIYPEFYNLNHRALNFLSYFRWDEEKRRVQAQVNGPIHGDPRQHFFLGTDLRNENWRVVPSFTGPVPILGALNLRREAVSAGYTRIPGWRWQWSAAAEFSHRDFRSVLPGPALSPEFLTAGDQLKESLQFDSTLWNNPDHRISLTGTALSETGRIWSSPPHTFEKLQGFAILRWFPRLSGDDYELQQRVSSGKTFGDVPFDELWMLGIGGDNNLWMRAHIATRDGMKGSAPLGRAYFLSNTALDKNLHDFGLFRLKAGPLLDTGKITDPLPGLGSHKWLWDTGGQVKVIAFGFGVALSYGKDLRSGNNAFYISLLR
jgi:tetratricopeptide (TPR) repeat protein